MPISLFSLCLLTVVLNNVCLSSQYGIPRRSYLSRRAIDGSRGRKYFDPHEEGTFDSFGSAGGQYDPYEEETDLADIRRNVPGEPGIDYPAYTTLPQTGFTCEGRSRGYYADEVAGCQVFHVCHDVLVSSFLCPIGSIFSQKLLTCDWWAKVDCSSTQKYTNINRDSYQPDDDEMIRNAYAMISLHSGKDVTQDGLVDPDRTGSIIDYHRDLSRIIDFPMLDSTANDLRHMFDDYRMREFLSAYHEYQKKQETNRNYPARLFPSNKSRPPLRDSRIIRIQKIEDPRRQKQNDFSAIYRRPNEFNDQFQPSYAPTVPTVTTTTRRLYSPTVPTTYKPPTVAYSKLDQLIDSSDQYYSETKAEGFVTPPTVFHNDDMDRRVSVGPNVGGNAGVASHSGLNYDNLYHDSETSIGQNNPGPLVAALDGGLVIQRKENAENFEEIDTRDSIGLGHALRQSPRRISINQQNPAGFSSKAHKEEGSVEDSANSTAVHGKGLRSNHDLRNLRNKTRQDNYQDLSLSTTTLRYQATTLRDEELDVSETDVSGKSDISGQSDISVQSDIFTKSDISVQSDISTKSDISVPSTTVPSTETTIEATTNILRDPQASTSLKEGLKELERSSYSDRTQETVVPPPVDFLTPPLESPIKFRINVPDVPKEVAALVLNYPNNQKTVNEQSTPKPQFEIVQQSEDNSRTTIIDRPDDKFRIHAGFYENEEGRRKEFDASRSEINRSLQESERSEDYSTKEENDSSSVSHRVTEQERRDNYNLGLEFNNKESSQTNSRSKTSLSTLRERFSSETESTTPLNLREEVRTLTPTESPLFSSFNDQVEVNKTRIDAQTRERKIEDRKIGDKEDSPYQVSLPVSRETEDEINESNLPEKITESEVVQSTEPKAEATAEFEFPATKNQFSNYSNYFSEDHSIASKPIDSNTNILSLRQLMQALLKLDRFPRPFSQSDTQTTFTDSIDSKRNTEIDKFIEETKEEDREEILKGASSQSTQSNLKDQILERLRQNFGQPLYSTQESELNFELPAIHRSLDFQTGLPLASANEEQTSRTILPSNEEISYKIEESTSTVPLDVPATNPPEKKITKTEFLPSIGFSLDTSEGREEYAEAILDGLINDHSATAREEEEEEEKSVSEKTTRTGNKDVL